jgi:mRNA interferase ChpB
VQRGEIWVVPLDPVSGHEQGGKRHVVVVSSNEFNKLVGTPVVLPITGGGDYARIKGFAVSLSGLGLNTQGVVRCDQPRTLDLKARGARSAREVVPAAVMDDICARVATIFE